MISFYKSFIYSFNRIKQNQRKREDLDINCESFSVDVELSLHAEELLEAKRRRLNDSRETLDDISNSSQAFKRDIEETLKVFDEKLLKVQADQEKAKVGHRMAFIEKTNKESEIAEFNVKVRELCGDRELEDVLKFHKVETEKYRSTHSTLDAKRVLFADYIKDLERDPSCPLCSTVLGPGIKDDLIQLIKEKIQSFPSLVEENETKLIQVNKKLDKLVELKLLKDSQMTLQSEVESLDTELIILKTEIEEKQITINTLKKDKESEIVQHKVYLNSELEEFQAKSAQLQKDIEALKISSAAKHELEKERQYPSDSKMQMEGKLKGLTDTLERDEWNLNEGKYKGANEEYSNTCQEEIRIENEIEGLKLHRVQLEQDLLQSHEMHMTKVNNTIRELWPCVYLGGDIERIWIHCFNDQKVIDGNKKRSYDYRVMQLRNGKESEMRFRCSAGQKILACLIIRLAIAETFECPFLAIDEPTTNLDDKNMKALSNEIRRLVTLERKKKLTFIVMSHSISFMQSLQQNEYFKLNRIQDGRSRIVKTYFN